MTRLAAAGLLVLATALGCGSRGVSEESVRAQFRRLREAPQSPEVWYELAVTAATLEQPGNARRAAQRVLVLEPAHAGARRLLAELGDTPPRRRPPRSPSPPDTVRRCAEARAAMDAGRFDDAAILLRAAAWMDEASPLPYQYLANLNVLRGRPRLALRFQRQALALAPNSPLYRRNLEALREALRSQARAVLAQPPAE